VKRAKQMRKFGRICFIILCIAFAIVFIGMVTLPPGGYDFAELPVLVRIALVIGLGLFVPMLVLILGAEVSRLLANRAIQAHGLQAEARVVKVWATGTRINRNPVVRVLLDVRPSNQDAFEAETEQLASIVGVGGVQPGKTIQVKYDPKSREVALMDARKT
jgi:hypothetical protein